MSNLLARVATAAVGAPIILALLYRAPPLAFYALVFPAALIGSYEFFTMTHPGDRPAQAAGVVLSAIASLAVYCGEADPRLPLSAFVAIPVLAPLVTLWRLGDIRTAALRCCALGLGPLFIAVPLTLLAVIRRDVAGDGPSYVVLALMFAWFSDTGAYFAGRFFGRKKLYERVSPKKTVEGSIGGIVAAVIGAIIAHFWFLPSIPLSHAIPLGLVAAMLGQLGDLSESLIKRSTGVKDSGHIVPGHGGILDRVDALLLTGTTVYLYTLWCT